MIHVAQLPANTSGRDIVIGDLHGHLDVLERLLEKANFDPVKDRVISTGDLPDRGPDSFGCLNLLFEPWFHAVRGNHEDHLCGLLSILFARRRSMQVDHLAALVREFDGGMGCGWLAEWVAMNEDWTPLEDLHVRLQAMPHILAVGAGPNRYNVVHAGLTAAGLESDVVIDAADGTGDADRSDSLMWSRKSFEEAVKHQGLTEDKHLEAPGLSRTFCGHNVTPFPIASRGHVFIDTGCGFYGRDWMRLTGIIVPGCEEISAAYLFDACSENNKWENQP